MCIDKYKRQFFYFSVSGIVLKWVSHKKSTVIKDMSTRFRNTKGEEANGLLILTFLYVESSFVFFTVFMYTMKSILRYKIFT